VRERTTRFEHGRTDTQSELLVVWRDVKQMGVVLSMAYTVTSDDTVGLAIGPVSETTNDVDDALRKARQMYETGLVNVSIENETGRKIDGDDLLDCITGKKKITEDLQAVNPDRAVV
jgi:hypothetical protein